MVVLGMSASTVPMMSPSPQANSELEFVVSGLNNKNENTMRKQKNADHMSALIAKT